MRLARFAALVFACSTAVTAAPPVDPDMLAKISDQGFNHGEVIETAAYLADQIGGRMTNSPAMRKAESWTQDRFRSWGLANVHKEGFEFGRGWWIEAASVQMVAPRPIMLRSIPVAWTPPTAGALTAPIIVAPLRRERDFALWHGKLAGKIVLVTLPTDPKDATTPSFRRASDEDLRKLNDYRQPSFDPGAADRTLKRRKFAEQLDQFLKAEGAVAWARMSYRENSLVTGEGSLYKVGHTPALPGVELAAEDYRRLARLAKIGPVTLRIDSNVHYDDSDTKAYNIIAEIPGSDPKAGYVMAGAHLDSWVAGDGAADNGAGSSMIMEAARILARSGVKPKRTIRFVLWAGEEEGLLGSAAYIAQHFVTRPPETDPDKLAFLTPSSIETWPVTPLPGFKDLAAYFNIDNGSGKLRGLYAEGNFGVVPIFKEWLAPFASMGANTVVAEPTGGTDHVLMQRIGLPGFQFIQDDLDYSSTVHHSNVDTFDHLRAADMRQGSVILATLLLDAANAEKPLPRLQLPTLPRPTNPFQYDDPDQN
ncbi:M20/M25/M40 family metallo-hydrolase [Sphingomonas sp. MMS24-J13]|uniref:M20/M25/M40 family metallo-hydrolase n=1 Tax=Sphingomonas sp. MMS24-J13 TaxID=3238686 RepID=UPI0038510BB6